MSKTLTQFLAQQNGLPAGLAPLIDDIARLCTTISDTVNRGAIAGILGSQGAENVQGEEQKKLDVIANDILAEALLAGGRVAGVASEEMDVVQPVPAGRPQGDYLVVYDPIDGSSNIDVNGVVGTIFSILTMPQGRSGQQATEADFLQPGTAQVAAGYVIYGPQTTLVLTVGQGVHAFSLDRATGAWLQTQEGLAVPASTKEFAINVAYQRHWEAPISRYIDEVIAGKDGARGVDFNMRWMGSMVGDVHRVLTRGGIFLYPTDRRANMRSGKLRLMYEANPIAFLIEQAGGQATDGARRILDIAPEKLHQRVGVVLGSADEVTRIADYHR